MAITRREGAAALVAFLVTLAAGPSWAGPAAAFPVHAEASGGCSFPTMTIDFGLLGKYTFPSANPVDWAAYLFCQMGAFLSGLVTYVANSLVAGVNAIFATVAGGFLTLGNGIVSGFTAVVAFIATPLQALGVFAPVATTIAVVVLIALGLTLVYALAVVGNRLYQLL